MNLTDSLWRGFAASSVRALCALPFGPTVVAVAEFEAAEEAY